MLLAAAGITAALALGPLTPEKVERPCLEFDRSGAGPVEVPCPEDPGGILGSSFLSSIYGDGGDMVIDSNMAIDPEWHWDRAMLADGDCRYDRATPTENATRHQSSPDDSSRERTDGGLRIAMTPPTPPVCPKPETPE